MVKGRQVITVLTPVANTDVANNSTFDDAFVKNWDKQPGAGQAMVRVRKRIRQGIKRTPIGKGVTTRS